jgi:dipeptide transport system substrate-binding protein
MKIKIFLSLVGFIIASLLFSEMIGYTAWINKATNSIQKHNEKNLVVCTSYEPAGFDVAQYADIENFEPSGPLFNKLVSFSEGSTTVLPSLATHWKISPDGLTYTFYLRQGVKFHTTNYFKPTRDFNADDVIFTFERMRNPKHPFNIAYPAEFPMFVSVEMDKNLKQIKKIDPFVVQFILRKPKVAFIQNIAKEFGAILSAEYANQLLRQGKAANINQKPIGTGPFILKRYMKGQKIHYIANKKYWDDRKNGLVKLDNLIFSIHKESNYGNQMLAGECHLASATDDEITKFKQNSQFVVHTQPGLDMWYIAYNTEKPILRKLAVRQALDMALNKTDLIKAYQGMATVAVNMMPPSQWPYDTSLKNTPYNPTKAKALLKASGYPNGFTLIFFINLKGNSAKKLVAEMIQADWKKIGVHVKFMSYESGEFWQHVDQGAHDVVFAGWNGNDGDPDNWFGNLLSCKSATGGFGNHSKWCYKPFDILVTKALDVSDPIARAKLYLRAQKIFKQQIPFSPLVHTLNTVIYNKKVKFDRTYIMPTINLEQYTGISIE